VVLVPPAAEEEELEPTALPELAAPGEAGEEAVVAEAGEVGPQAVAASSEDVDDEAPAADPDED
jgi:hypothetical protein